MSYKYRKNKRNLAHFMLSKLEEERLLFEQDQSEQNWPCLTCLKFSEKYSTYSKEQYDEAASLLYANKHIDFPDGTYLRYEIDLILTDSGKNAYYEGFYKKENKKDFLEWVELRTKWLIPIISLIISIAALLFTILKKCKCN